MSGPGQVELRRIGKRYDVDGGAMTVLQDINLCVPAGSFVSIVGSSGCGKSTLLRLIVGLDDAHDGEILLDGQPQRGTSPSRGIVFQDHRLLPWMTLEQNIALALESIAWDAARKRAVVARAIELFCSAPAPSR